MTYSSILLPWWVSVCKGAPVYFGLAYIAPAFSSAGPIIGTFAKMAPVYAQVGGFIFVVLALVLFCKPVDQAFPLVVQVALSLFHQIARWAANPFCPGLPSTFGLWTDRAVALFVILGAGDSRSLATFGKELPFRFHKGIVPHGAQPYK